MNAIEAMNDLRSRTHYLELRTEIDNDRVLVTVGDSGPGVSEENIAKIFAPFYTTKPEGMGMGLAICQSIIEAHGGRMTARNGKYVGIVVQVELPLFAKHVSP